MAYRSWLIRQGWKCTSEHPESEDWFAMIFPKDSAIKRTLWKTDMAKNHWQLKIYQPMGWLQHQAWASVSPTAHNWWCGGWSPCHPHAVQVSWTPLSLPNEKADVTIEYRLRWRRRWGGCNDRKVVLSLHYILFFSMVGKIFHVTNIFNWVATCTWFDLCMYRSETDGT